MRVQIAAVMLAALCAIGGRHTARAIDVLSLGVQRGYNDTELLQVVIMGSSMATARGALAQDGIQLVTTEVFTEETLRDYRTVFLGLFDPAESLQANEQDALEDFVRGGGSLIYLGDNGVFGAANESVAGLFGVVYGTDTGVGFARQVVDPSHPIVNGPAGRVTEYDVSGNLPGFGGAITDLGPHAHAIVAKDQTSLVAAIERDELAPGSGAVVFLADANGLLDEGLGTVQLGDNLTLIRNIFAFACGECESDGDCSDGMFCNGTEVCRSRRCVSGTPPCQVGKACYESADSCGPCTDDDACQDGQFCNGVEVCDSAGTCRSGMEPCEDPCEKCDETSHTCRWCMYDLDQNGVIGTGDFALLSACIGGCYSADDVCNAANFDNDPGCCVGSAEFAGFSGCFDSACNQCPDCVGPGSVSKEVPPGTLPGSIHLRLRAVYTAAKRDAADRLPEITTEFAARNTFTLEIWASRQGWLSDGLAAVFLDLRYDPQMLDVQEVMSSSLFAVLPNGTVDRKGGVVRAVGGCAMPGDAAVAVDDRWVRVATLRMIAKRAGETVISTGSAAPPLGISIVGELSNLTPSRIKYGTLELTFHERAQPLR